MATPPITKKGDSFTAPFAKSSRKSAWGKVDYFLLTGATHTGNLPFPSSLKEIPAVPKLKWRKTTNKAKRAHLHIRAERDQLRRWHRAATADKRSLTAWVAMHLDKLADTVAPA